MDHAVSWGMDRGMDHGVWIVCGPGTLIHALYLYPLPYNQRGGLSYPKRVGYHAQKVGYHTQKGGLPYTIPIEPTHSTAAWETTAPAVFRM